MLMVKQIDSHKVKSVTKYTVNKIISSQVTVKL